MTHTNLDGKSSLGMKLIQGSPNLAIKDTLISNVDPNERKQIALYLYVSNCIVSHDTTYNSYSIRLHTNKYVLYITRGWKTLCYFTYARMT